jgi:acyl-CoA synthetase (AMP-forming)/AMP-acid ligase II
MGRTRCYFTQTGIILRRDVFFCLTQPVQNPEDQKQHPTLEELRSWARPHLASYKIPSLVRVLKNDQELPRNGMGKVVKKEVVAVFTSS